MHSLWALCLCGGVFFRVVSRVSRAGLWGLGGLALVDGEEEEATTEDGFADHGWHGWRGETAKYAKDAKQRVSRRVRREEKATVDYADAADRAGRAEQSIVGGVSTPREGGWARMKRSRPRIERIVANPSPRPQIPQMDTDEAVLGRACILARGIFSTTDFTDGHGWGGRDRETRESLRIRAVVHRFAQIDTERRRTPSGFETPVLVSLHL